MEGRGAGAVLLLHKKHEKFKCPLNATNFNSTEACLVLVFATYDSNADLVVV